MSLHFETEARPSTHAVRAAPNPELAPDLRPVQSGPGQPLLPLVPRSHTGTGACSDDPPPCPILSSDPLLQTTPGALHSLLVFLSLFLPSSLFPLLTFFLLPFFFLLPRLPPSSPPSSSLLLLSYFPCPSLALAQGLGPSCMVEGSDNRVPHPHCGVPPPTLSLTAHLHVGCTDACCREAS